MFFEIQDSHKKYIDINMTHDVGGYVKLDFFRYNKSLYFLTISFYFQFFYVNIAIFVRFFLLQLGYYPNRYMQSMVVTHNRNNNLKIIIS
jgi:hypothetical protein